MTFFLPPGIKGLRQYAFFNSLHKSNTTFSQKFNSAMVLENIKVINISSVTFPLIPKFKSSFDWFCFNVLLQTWFSFESVRLLIWTGFHYLQDFLKISCWKDQLVFIFGILNFIVCKIKILNYCLKSCLCHNVLYCRISNELINWPTVFYRKQLADRHDKIDSRIYCQDLWDLVHPFL